MWQYHPLLVIFSLGGLVSIGVGLYCWRYMQRYGSSYLVGGIGLVGVVNAIWAFAAMLKTASATVDASLFYYKLEFLGSGFGPALWLVISIAYVGKERWLTRRVLAALGGISVTFVALIVVNPRNLMITEAVLIPAQGIMAFEHSFPPLFTVSIAWQYGLVTLSLLLLARGIVSGRVPKWPTLVAMLTFGIPLLTNTLKIFGIYPPGGRGINVTPAASTIGIGILAFALVQYRIFDLIPVGRDQATEVMEEGYLLFDEDGTIVDANPSARSLLTGENGTTVQGRPVADVVPMYDGEPKSGTETFVSDGRTIEVRKSNVNRQNQAAGGVLLLQDVTEREERRKELERNERIMTNLPVAVAQIRPEEEQGFAYVNDGLIDMFGFDSKAAAKATPDRELYADPTDRDSLSEEIQASGRADDAEVQFKKVDGRRFWGSLTASVETIDNKTSIIAVVQDITERKAYEQQLEAALDSVQSERDGKEAIRQLLLESSSDQQLLDSVCQLLVEEYGYEAAWIVRDWSGDPAGPHDIMTVANYGDDRGFREGIAAERPAINPSKRAFESESSVAITVDEVTTDDEVTGSATDDVAELLASNGLFIVKSVPLKHEGITHGSLTVLGDESGSSLTETLLTELADAIAFKQQVSQQRDALVADRVVEIDIRIGNGDNVLCQLASACPADTQLEAHEFREVEGDRTRYLLKADGLEGDLLVDAATEVDGVHDPMVLAEGENAAVRVTVEKPTLGTILSRFGGVVQSMAANDRHVDATVQFSRRTDVSEVVETVGKHWPEATLRSRSELSVTDEQQTAFGTLTEKQEQALQAAYLTGFFDRPQQATANEVAETLDVSRSTFLHHLRTAERKVFAEAFDAER